MADAKIMMAKRDVPLANSSFGNDVVRVRSSSGDMTRLSLRAGAEAYSELEKAFELELPKQPKGVVENGSLAALWIGPDEWLLIDQDGRDLMALARGAKGVFSAVDVSHRNTGFILEGKGAAACLAAACPQDLSDNVFAAGCASRTLLGKAEIVLWRQDDDQWHVECWRSFAPYVFGMLAEGAKDARLLVT